MDKSSLYSRAKVIQERTGCGLQAALAGLQKEQMLERLDECETIDDIKHFLRVYVSGRA